MDKKMPNINVIRMISITSIVAVSLAGVLVRGSQLAAIPLAFFRMLFTVGIMLPQLFLHRKEPIFSPEAAEKKIKGKLILLSIGSGFLLSLHLLFWNQAIQMTKISTATMLSTTHPVFVLIFGALFFKENVDRRIIKWIILAMIGTVLITFFDNQSQSSGSTLTGNLLALSTAVFFCFYLFVGRYVRQYTSVTHYTFMVYLVALINYLVCMLIFKFSFGPFPAREYLIFLLLAIFPTLLGHSLFNWTLKYLKAAYVSVILLLEPMFATIFALIIYREAPSIFTVIIGPIVIFSIYQFSNTMLDEAQVGAVVTEEE